MSEHRWCAMHIWSIWHKRWRGIKFQNQFWRCAKSTYEQYFIDQLEQLDAIRTRVANDVLKWPPIVWCGAYQNTTCKADCVDNNMCKAFNGSILEARTMHIQ